MKRYEAVKMIVDALTGDEIIVSCTGLISRELHSIKDTPRNFYMLGSMGLPSSVGLGLAVARPEKRIIILEGDGGMLMCLGTIATIGYVKPKNLIQIVLDNETYESTGGQDTVSKTTQLESVAVATGYKNVKKVVLAEELISTVKDFLTADGPSFILVKIEAEKKDVPRVSIEPTEIKNRVRSQLKDIRGQIV